jgi:hypothetical protein
MASFLLYPIILVSEMRQYLKYSVFLFGMLSVIACTERLDLTTPLDSRLVVEGLITNEPGPYYIRLMLSKNKLSFNYMTDTAYHQTSGFKSIIDALVIVSDNSGLSDTLIYPPDDLPWYFRDSTGNILDTFSNSNLFAHKIGYYQTTKIKGTIRNTYNLKIIWNKKEYHASCYMPSLPAVDSINYKLDPGLPGKSSFFVPHIYFKDPPNEKNYYLFEFGGMAWGYSVLNDEFLNGYVNGLDVFKGETSDWWINSYPWAGEDYIIHMYSITEEGYNYYKALISQFKNDGGSYSPSPASPPTNIDNGALGFFRASAVNVIKGRMPNEY